MVVEIAKVGANIADNFTKKLKDLEQKLLDNKKNNNEFGEYYNYICSGTNSRKARVIRGDIFLKNALE